MRGERTTSLSLKLWETAASGALRLMDGLDSVYQLAVVLRKGLLHGSWLSASSRLGSYRTILINPPTNSSTEQIRNSCTAAPSAAVAFGAVAQAGSTYVPTLTAPPANSVASGSSGRASPPWLLFLASQSYRTVPHSVEACTKGPPGCTQLVKSQMGTGAHCTPRARS